MHRSAPCCSLVAASFLFVAQPLSAATPAQDRLAAVSELQQTFDGSLMKNMDLKFSVVGAGCDVLHVEADSIYSEMMEALANGTVIYGKILPGGVSSFAFGHGFRDVFYSNRRNKVFHSYGPGNLKRGAALKLRTCTESIAASVTTSAPKGPVPMALPFVPLSWASAVTGQKIYNASYKHEATIVAVDKSSGLIRVKYVRGGSVESKRLESVATVWYVQK
jgi:hypothetical protein